MARSSRIRRPESIMLSILENKNTSSPSVFLPAALLREARRQKGLATVDVPPVCILDPDGDIVRPQRQAGQSQPFESWPCYHTKLDTFTLAGQTVRRLCCRRTIRRPRRGRTFRQWLSYSAERDVRGSNRSSRRSASLQRAAEIGDGRTRSVTWQMLRSVLARPPVPVTKPALKICPLATRANR
jgi:hypothetical protein